MRCQKLEYIDLGPSHYTPDEYRDCLRLLGKIGKYLGDRATFWAFDRLDRTPTSILDVGCGGGSFTLRLAKRYPSAKVVGIDTSEAAILLAKEQAKEQKVQNVTFERTVDPKLTYPPQSFDVVTSTLVCHHLSDQELIDFLNRAAAVAKEAVIINDLHRHPLAWLGFAMVAPLFFYNRLILHDGLLSIRRAFVKKDWEQYCAASTIPRHLWNINWKWAFRWIITITTKSLSAAELQD